MPNKRPSLLINYSTFSNRSDLIVTPRLLMLRKLTFLGTPHFIPFLC